MELLVEPVNGLKFLNISAETSTLDIWMSSECASDKCRKSEFSLKAWQLIVDKFSVL